LSIYRLLILQRKPKLGHTKLSTGRHVGHGLDVAGLNKKEQNIFLLIR